MLANKEKLVTKLDKLNGKLAVESDSLKSFQEE